MSQKRPNRRPRSKAELLPLPAAHVRSISLENHLALATIRSGQGTPETMIALLRVLYLGYFLVEPDVSDTDLELFLGAESVLQQSIDSAASGQEWNVPNERLSMIEQLLLKMDVLVASVPKYRYVQAWDKLGRFANSPKYSPLPGSRLNNDRKQPTAVLRRRQQNLWSPPFLQP
ncbi:hypothetical protein [Burkholderia sp. JP2-270]|uniref:hypothetical protein n=1 Tax=Burkholderia sp. JP2-270 TaxID=2217913 RepID=UPI0019550D2A|nr:hypothetical protein [Burkholderia sp. JP2-270]